MFLSAKKGGHLVFLNTHPLFFYFFFISPLVTPDGVSEEKSGGGVCKKKSCKVLHVVTPKDEGVPKVSASLQLELGS